ncbi:hypothetical protein U0L13_003323 [Providencia stuartii]|nr:hypothetical protein [Providencia stuartii]
MKKYILLLLFSFTLVLITSFALHTESDDVNLCHSDILWIKNNGTDDGLMLKSKTSILVTSDNMGRMNMYGYVKENNVFYRLDRALYFNYQSIDKKNNYSIRFKTLSITSSDNVPQALFANFIQLEEEKINYYINVTKMNDNIYIIKDEAYSSFTCYADK